MLQPVDLGLRDAQRALAFREVITRGAEIGARSNRSSWMRASMSLRRTGGMQPGQTHGGIRFVRRAVGGDPHRMLGDECRRPATY